MKTCARGFYFAAALSTFAAEARTYDIYRADYVKGSFCATIAGACASDNDFDSAAYQNPASLTATESNWDFDWDIIKNNSLEPQMRSSSAIEENVFSGFVAYAGEKFGLGLSVAYQSDQVHSRATVTNDGGDTAAIDLTTKAATYFVNTPVSYRLTPEMSIGAGISMIFHKETLDVSGSSVEGSVQSSPTPGIGFFVGGLYMPNPYFRFGSWFRSSLAYSEQIKIHFHTLTTDINYSDRARLQMPWIWPTGISYMPWADRRTASLDLAIVGWTPDGYLLSYDGFASAINDQRMHEKGRKITAEPRAGWRSPIVADSAWTYMLGSYLEPSRSEGFYDRPHFTGGIAYKIPFKAGIIDGVELMTGMDVAAGFQQLFFTWR